jgi:hypothetical protein
MALFHGNYLQNAKISEDLTTTNIAELSEKGQWLKDLLPKNTEVSYDWFFFILLACI